MLGSHLVCNLCGRRAQYLWQVGRLRGCRKCARKVGLRVVYPAQAAFGFRGCLPVLMMRKGVT